MLAIALQVYKLLPNRPSRWSSLDCEEKNARLSPTGGVRFGPKKTGLNVAAQQQHRSREGDQNRPNWVPPMPTWPTKNQSFFKAARPSRIFYNLSPFEMSVVDNVGSRLSYIGVTPSTYSGINLTTLILYACSTLVTIWLRSLVCLVKEQKRGFLNGYFHSQVLMNIMKTSIGCSVGISFYLFMLCIESRIFGA